MAESFGEIAVLTVAGVGCQWPGPWAGDKPRSEHSGITELALAQEREAGFGEHP
jgi:hypothetical protein